MENLELGVQFATFVTGVVTTIIVSWIPKILEIIKESRKIKSLEKRKMEESQILIMEILDEFHSLSFTYNPKLEGSTHDFEKAQEIMTFFFMAITEKQKESKDIDFLIYKMLFNFKKEIREFLNLELQTIEEIGETGYPEVVEVYPPFGWLDQYNNLIKEFKQLEQKLEPLN